MGSGRVGGWQKLSGMMLTQSQPDDFGMSQQSDEYFAPNPKLSSFDMDFALKFRGDDQKK